MLIDGIRSRDEKERGCEEVNITNITPSVRWINVSMVRFIVFRYFLVFSILTFEQFWFLWCLFHNIVFYFPVTDNIFKPSKAPDCVQVGKKIFPELNLDFGWFFVLLESSCSFWFISPPSPDEEFRRFYLSQTHRGKVPLPCVWVRRWCVKKSFCSVASPAWRFLSDCYLHTRLKVCSWSGSLLFSYVSSWIITEEQLLHFTHRNVQSCKTCSVSEQSRTRRFPARPKSLLHWTRCQFEGRTTTRIQCLQREKPLNLPCYLNSLQWPSRCPPG